MRSKIIKNTFLMAFLVTVLPTNLYAFHTITEILNNNKLIICKDYDQVKTDQKVEVYTRKFSNNRRGTELEKTEEFILPKAGQQITLHHNELHSTSKFFPTTHTEILGTATVVNTKIAGEARVVKQVSKNKRETVERKTEIITEQDEAKILKNCFVAVLDKEIKLKDVTSISF
ncbi:hypothetical protein SHI21_19775 [Bacteriovorax sp. PP10]|uniref:Organic solvent tolerance-like N-terminal domain-containing protein n=1 Tax=Bacteriovorax antarcticus TaxID=3088717 RepID=A0ABU5VZQ7_9BACT|nr:hypothetical protein [Bacteriovorax sp. PP10]MEA9358486.1 hypothetical protein [Bacteriovorax sp. PP10]